MKIKVTDAIDVGEIVWEWTEIHPEVKKYFRIMYEYVPALQALRLTMERAYPDETKYGIVRLLPEDIMGNMVCPSDYINAVLEEMYKKLTEDSDLEKKLRNYVKCWTIVCIDRREHIAFDVRPEGSDGYMVSFEKDIENDFAVNTVIVKRYIPKKKVENWDADEGYVAEALSDLYRRLKEKEKKMGYFSGTVNVRCESKGDNDTRLKMAKAAVVAWYNEHNAPATIGMEDVYIVWFCKTLQNWKALAGTHHSDGMYYEITFDGDKDCAYVYAYKKWQNVQMSGHELKEAI